MTEGDNSPEKRPPAEASAAHTQLRRFAPFQAWRAAWREWRFARRTAQAALALFRRIREQQPELAGRALYEAIVCQRNGIEAYAARVILRHADDSFAAWPKERALIFRDVVQYLVITEYLLSNSERTGTATNMAKVVAKIIPMEF
jgi:hypothetical protein